MISPLTLIQSQTGYTLRFALYLEKIEKVKQMTFSEVTK